MCSLFFPPPQNVHCPPCLPERWMISGGQVRAVWPKDLFIAKGKEIEPIKDLVNNGP